MLVDKLHKHSSVDERSVKVKNNIFYSVAIQAVSIAVSFLLVPLTIGYVSAELYGVWLTLSSILTWLNVLDLGFSQGMKNKLTEAIAFEDWKRGKRLVSTTYLLMAFIFVPLCILFQFIIPLVDWCNLLNISSIYKVDIVKTMHALVFICCFQMIIKVVVSVIAAFQKVALSNSFGVIGNIISLIIIVVITRLCPPSLLYLCFSLATMPVLVMLVASFILFNGSLKRVSPSPKSFDRSLLKELFNLGYKFFIINIQAIVIYQTTNVLISNVSSPQWVSSYNIAYKLLSMAMILFTIATQPLWPAFADAYVKGDVSWMKTMKYKMTKFYIFSVVCCLLIALFSPYIYRIWIGDNSLVSKTMTWLVCLYVVIYCWTNFNGVLLVGMSKLKLNTIVVSIGMVIHIPLSYLLSDFLGAYGVITSMILINFIYSIVYKVQVEKILSGTAKGIWNQ